MDELAGEQTEDSQSLVNQKIDIQGKKEQKPHTELQRGRKSENRLETWLAEPVWCAGDEKGIGQASWRWDQTLTKIFHAAVGH